MAAWLAETRLPSPRSSPARAVAQHASQSLRLSGCMPRRRLVPALERSARHMDEDNRALTPAAGELPAQANAVDLDEAQADLRVR